MIAVKLGGAPDERLAQDGETILQQALNQLETYWLADEKPFLAGENISVADLLCCCELEQLCMLPADSANNGGSRAERVEDNANSTGNHANSVENKANSVTDNNGPTSSGRQVSMASAGTGNGRAGDGSGDRELRIDGALGGYLARRPRTAAWVARVRQRCGRAYEEAHAVLRRAAAAPQARSKL